MNIDLGLKIGNRYSIVTLAFFIPYICEPVLILLMCLAKTCLLGLEIPSQIGLRAFGARIWLGGATIAWGVVMLSMGFVTNWQTLAGLRALLGVFEATLFPGSVYLIACWYPRSKMASRALLVHGCSVVAEAFQG